MKVVRLVLFTVCFTACWTQCAVQEDLSGGAKDRQPPQVLPDESTPSLQTNFYPESLVFTFDEYIKLNNPTKQVTLIPKINTKPKFQLKGKRLKVVFDSETIFEENTTYIMQFGQAISDITENNVQNNLNFIFATGEHIDSLSATFKVLDQNTAAENVLVSIYGDLSTDKFSTEKPDYYAFTDAQGQASIKHLKPGPFRVYVLDDQNNNFTFDEGSEKYQYLDEAIFVNDSLPTLELQLMEDLKPPILRNAFFVLNNLIGAYFSGNNQYTKTQIFPNTSFSSFIRNDSLFLFSSTSFDALEAIHFSSDYRKTDSLYRDRMKTWEKQPEIKLASTNAYLEKDSLTVELNFDWPVLKIDPAGIELVYMGQAVSNPIAKISIQAFQNNQSNVVLRFASDLVADSLRLSEGAVTSVLGQNKINLEEKIKVIQNNQFSNLIIKLSDLDSSAHYICRLMNGEKVVREFYINDRASENLVLNRLEAKLYQLLVIEDMNENALFDEAYFPLLQRPESTHTFPITGLKPNWDVEIELTIK